MRTIGEVLQASQHRFGDASMSNSGEWSALGLNGEQVQSWLDAGVFSATVARELINRGVEPERLIKAGSGNGDITETLGYRLSTGTIAVDEVMAEIGS